jgi:predicted nucleic acid-binding protein
VYVKRTLALDASTAILLAKVGLLRQIVTKGEVWMGATAAAEAVAKKSDDAIAIASLLEEGHIHRTSLDESSHKLIREFRLGPGEAEAIILAREKDALCATDDGPAIRCCKVLGIPFTTAIGFLVALAESGELGVELALALLAKLERFGRYHARILEDASRRISATEEKRGKR